MHAILIASDHAGFALKEKMKSYLKKLGYRVKDLGTRSPDRCDYPLFAYDLARQVSLGRNLRGILICYSGIGNSIVANKLPGVYAALCHNIKTARLSRQHNNSNILVLGSAFVSTAVAKRIARVWLTTEFLGGRHARRFNLIKKIEKKHFMG